MALRFYWLKKPWRFGRCSYREKGFKGYVLVGRGWLRTGPAPAASQGCEEAAPRGGKRGSAKQLWDRMVPAISRPRTWWHHQLHDPSPQSALQTPSTPCTNWMKSLASPWSSLTCDPDPTWTPAVPHAQELEPPQPPVRTHPDPLGQKPLPVLRRTRRT